MSKQTNNAALTLDSLRTSWENEFLPSIRREIKTSMDNLEHKLELMAKRIDSIEDSQKFISDKYDTATEIIQATKKQVSDLSSKIKGQEEAISNLTDASMNSANTMDDVQQYLRRDCLEITGIPTIPNEDTKQLVLEVSEVIGVELTINDLSTVHRLPDTKKTKDRIIAKFTRRDKREEVYSKRRKLFGKTTVDLPSVRNNLGTSIPEASNVYINESLTSYRKMLFGKVYAFKKKSKWKYIWTVNGKILLRENETSQSYSFTTNEDFAEFLEE